MSIVISKSVCLHCGDTIRVNDESRLVQHEAKGEVCEGSGSFGKVAYTEEED